MAAEHLEDGEAEGEQRDERQERGVDQAHGAQVDLAAPQVADHRVGVAQHAQAWRASSPGAVEARPEKHRSKKAQMRTHMA